MDTIDKNISINLRKIRKEQNMSLDMLSERTLVSKSMLGQIERGESNPTITTIAKICEGLRIGIEDLLYREKDPISLVKKDQCRVTRSAQSRYAVRLVFPFDKDRNFEIYTISIEAGAQMQLPSHGAHTTEYITVTQGTLILRHENKELKLACGDSACLLVPRGHAFWDKESIPLAELRGQRVLLPSLRQDLFSPLWSACARSGFAPNAEIGPSFYQAYYLVQEQLCTCLTRYEPGARRELDRVRDVLLEDLPPLCVSLVQRRDHSSAYIDLLRSYLMEVLGGSASLPPRRGRPAKPFYNFPVLSSAAAKAAPAHPVPGTQLDFAGGTNFRELGGYEADEGKHIKWGQIWRGIPTCKLTGEADRAKLDALGLRLILDLRSSGEVQKEPDYVPDGARLVQICGLCAEDGHEISFAPDGIAALMKGHEESADGSTFMQAMYERMLFGNKAFKELFRALEAGETPILFHCSAGKDRTGVAAMLILLALGASDETICADYERTNLCRKAEIDAVLAEHAEEIAANPACRMRYYRKAGVDPAAAPFVLRTIRAKYGSAENYLEAEYGLTPARLMRLRRMYLE